MQNRSILFTWTNKQGSMHQRAKSWVGGGACKHSRTRTVFSFRSDHHDCGRGATDGGEAKEGGRRREEEEVKD